MKCLMLHCLASSLHRCQHYIYPCRNRIKTKQNSWQHICKGKDDYVYQLSYSKYENKIFSGKSPMEFIASSLLCVNIFCVKALRQWSHIREAMKRWNIDYDTLNICLTFKKSYRHDTSTIDDGVKNPPTNGRKSANALKGKIRKSSRAVCVTSLVLHSS